MLPGAADYLKQTWIPWQKLGPAHITPGKLEVVDFTLKTLEKCFPSTQRRRNIKKTTITGHIKFGLEENTVRNHVTSSFLKIFVFKIFFVDTKTNSRCFQIPPVWGAFSKSWFRMEGLTVENKTAFPNFSGVVWTLEFLACYHIHLHENMIWFWSSLAVEASHGVRNLKPASMWCHSSGETCSRR